MCLRVVFLSVCQKRMKLLDGKSVAEAMLCTLEIEVSHMGIRPGLGVLLVGDDAASHLYVSLKERVAERLGVRFEKRFLFESVSLEEAKHTIEGFNSDPNIHGILVQLPLPPQFPVDEILGVISPDKDADGFHPENERRFAAGKAAFPPVFPHAILELIRATGESLSGKRAFVLGNSYRFGDMMCRVLSREGIDAKHIPASEAASEQGLSELKAADIVISACGRERMITGVMLKEGVIVIDGGIVKDGARVTGDVDRASVEELDGWLSPVPGGVGPVTIACLFANVIEAAKRQKMGSEES